MRSRRLWLCVAPTVLCLADRVFAKPVDSLDLEASAAVLPWVLWISLFSLAVVFLPLRPAKVLALALTLGHALRVGALKGLGHLPVPESFVFLASAVLIVTTWEKAGAEARDDAAPSPGGEDLFLGSVVRLRRLLLVAFAVSLCAIAYLELASFQHLRKARAERRQLTAKLAGYGSAVKELDEIRRMQSALDATSDTVEELNRLPSPWGFLWALAEPELGYGILIQEARLAHGVLHVRGLVDGDRAAEKLQGRLFGGTIELEVTSVRENAAAPKNPRFPGGGVQVDLRKKIGKGFLERLAEAEGPAE